MAYSGSTIKIALLALSFFGIGLFAVPTFSLAQQTIEGNCTTDGDGYCLLEPLPLGTSGATFNSVNATTTLSDYLNTFFKIGIGIIGVLAVIMLIVGGVQYMTTDAIGGKESGKETITNAIGGLLLALGSYLILVTINPQLISLQFGIHSVNMSGVEAGLPSGVEFGDTDNSPAANAAVDPSAPAAFGTGIIDDSKWRVIFTSPPYNAVIKGSGGPGSENCKTVGQKNCTTLLGLLTDHVHALRQGCPNCQIIITGGSEYWLHKSHGPNKPIVDLSKTTSVHDYIHSAPGMKKWCRVGWPLATQDIDDKNFPCAGSIQYWIPSIKVGFIDEGNHYHTTSTAPPQ